MAREVHLVSNQYENPSIEDIERQRRGIVNLKYHITGHEQTRPKDMQLALRSPNFKVDFFCFLAAQWMDNSYAEILSGHQIFLALDRSEVLQVHRCW